MIISKKQHEIKDFVYHVCIIWHCVSTLDVFLLCVLFLSTILYSHYLATHVGRVQKGTFVMWCSNFV